PLGGGRMTNTRRIELLEKDREDQSRVPTALVESSKTFSPEQMAQIKAAMIDVLGDGGLRLGDAKDDDEARKDFIFLRAFRRAAGGLASGIGWLVIVAIVGAVIWLVNNGLQAWRG